MTALAHENAMMSSFAGNISDVMAMASSSKRDINHSGQYNSAYDDQTTGTVYIHIHSNLSSLVMLTSDLSSHVNNASTTPIQNLIGCSTISQDYSMLIG